MKTIDTMKYAVVGLLLFAACAVGAAVSSEQVVNSGVYNIRATGESVFAGGQPSQEQLEILQKAGVKHIVNLRPRDEMDWDEQQAVEALGMHYVNIPISGAADINTENANKLQAYLAAMKGESGLVHCASGNRVGGLIAVIEAEFNGKDVEQAIAEGKRWGLTRLEPVVREKLSN